MKYKPEAIRDDVPMPEQPAYRGAKWERSKYPFAEMEVGQSVFFPGHPAEGPAKWAASKFAKRNGVKLVFRTEAGGLRIWRDA